MDSGPGDAGNDIEAITAANQLAAEGMQAIGKRQAELFQGVTVSTVPALGVLGKIVREQLCGCLVLT